LGEETIIITLAKWEGGRLAPFTPGGKQGWQQNEIRMRKKNVTEITLPTGLETAVDKAKQLMPSKGKWTNILPMVWDADKALWAGEVIDSGGPSRVYYDSEKGLIYGYELERMSNDDQLEKDELI